MNMKKLVELMEKYLEWEATKDKRLFAEIIKELDELTVEEFYVFLTAIEIKRQTLDIIFN